MNTRFALLKEIIKKLQNNMTNVKIYKIENLVQ